MTEIKLINIIELNYNNEDTLQEIINNNNKVKILDIKCDICNKEYYREINKSIILNKDIILLINDKQCYFVSNLEKTPINVSSIKTGEPDKPERSSILWSILDVI